MKDKTKIIYLVTFVMTKHKWFRNEINYLEENVDIEVHELCDFLFPGARSTLSESHKSKKIFSFKTFLDWKNYVLNLQQKCIKEKKKLVFLSELSKYPTSQGYNLKYMMVNKFLKKYHIDYYEFNCPGAMPTKSYTKNYLNYINIFRYFKFIILRLNELMTNFLATLLDVKPKGIFIAGNWSKKKFENYKHAKDIELVDFNSWEFSSTIDEKKENLNSFKKYGVFINMPNPKKETDSVLLHLYSPETYEKWYPALDNFFSYLEKIFNLKIIIASHPKSNEEGLLNYLGNRTAILNKTEELVKGSEFVVGRNSTALAFAIIYKKPIFFIYSNETKKSTHTLNSINQLSNYFNTKSINIDENFSENQIKSLISIDKKLYENYKNEFLASNSKNKNYRIILDYLNR